MTRALYVVPDDARTPYPVTFDRMVATLRRMDYAVDVLVEGRAAGAVFDGIPFLFSLDARERFLSTRAVWDSGLPIDSDSRGLFAITDQWNREKYFPTLYSLDEDGNLRVCADFVVDTLAGLNDRQLRDNLATGISTGAAAIAYVREAARSCVFRGMASDRRRARRCE